MAQRPDARLSVRFGDEVLQRGHTAVPNLVLDYYARLGIAPAEMLFTIHVWQHWWTARDPHPSLRTIAAKMNISVRQAKRYVAALERKGFLHVVERFAPHGGQLTNEFDYSPLIRAVVRAARADGTLAARSPGVTRRVRSRDGDVTLDTPPIDRSAPSPGDGMVTPAPARPVAPGGAAPSPKQDGREEHTHSDTQEREGEYCTHVIHNQGRPLPQQLWAAALTALATRIEPRELEAWLRPARIVAWHAGVVVLAAPTTVACRRITRRYSGLLRTTLAALAGEALELACVSEAAWRAEGLAAVQKAEEGGVERPR